MRILERLWRNPFSECFVRLSACLVFGVALCPILLADGDTVLHDGWKVQSSAKVSASPEQVSAVGFPAEGWYPTSAPKTVFAVLVENGVYKDPYFGMNLRSVPGVTYKVGGQFANDEIPDDSPYAVPWWYRKEFIVPSTDKGKRIWLAFRGINYRADIWLNGKKLAGSDTVAGAFRRYEFDVTDFVHVGAKNALPVAVTPPAPAELGMHWFDWNPPPRDKDL